MNKNIEIIKKLIDETLKNNIVWEKGQEPKFGWKSLYQYFKGEKQLTPGKKMIFVFKYSVEDYNISEINVWFLNIKNKSRELIWEVSPGIFSFKTIRYLKKLVDIVNESDEKNRTHEGCPIGYESLINKFIIFRNKEEMINMTQMLLDVGFKTFSSVNSVTMDNQSYIGYVFKNGLWNRVFKCEDKKLTKIDFITFKALIEKCKKNRETEFNKIFTGPLIPPNLEEDDDDPRPFGINKQGNFEEVIY
jgi:hypothetical protein